MLSSVCVCSILPTLVTDGLQTWTNIDFIAIVNVCAIVMFIIACIIFLYFSPLFISLGFINVSKHLVPFSRAIDWIDNASISDWVVSIQRSPGWVIDNLLSLPSEIVIKRVKLIVINKEIEMIVKHSKQCVCVEREREHTINNWIALFWI